MSNPRTEPELYKNELQRPWSPQEGDEVTVGVKCLKMNSIVFIYCNVWFMFDSSRKKKQKKKTQKENMKILSLLFFVSMVPNSGQLTCDHGLRRPGRMFVFVEFRLSDLSESQGWGMQPNIKVTLRYL